jgi:hypothetical protein
MSSAFAHFSSSLSALFPILHALPSLQLEDSLVSLDSLGTTSSWGYIAYKQRLVIAQKTNLLFIGLSEDENSSNIPIQAEVEAEVEFDHDILVATWDIHGACLAVCDVSGTLHLLSEDGTILLSKQVLKGMFLIII